MRFTHLSKRSTVHQHFVVAIGGLRFRGLETDCRDGALRKSWSWEPECRESVLRKCSSWAVHDSKPLVEFTIATTTYAHK
eukprot:796454-Rhodomonas_salina.1